MVRIVFAGTFVLLSCCYGHAADIRELINGFPKSMGLTAAVEVLGTAKDGNSTIVIYQNSAREIRGAHCFPMNVPAQWACDVGGGRWIQVTK